MRRLKFFLVFFILLLFPLIIHIYHLSLRDSDNYFKKNGYNCTNFAASFNETVLFGNSEDASENHPLYENPDGTVIWFLPASAEGYGMMQIGWYWQGSHISYQGGINEYGLCYDSTGIPDINLNDHPEKPYNTNDRYFWSDLLRKCRNITEAIVLINQFNFKHMWYQVFLIDVTGDAVIVTPNYSGELNFTHKGVDDGYLAQTNFNRIHPESHYGSYPCPRYETTINLLSNLNNEDNLTVDYFRTILDAIHQNSFDSYTPYSNIFNPNQQMIYLYFASQFDETVQLNLTYELSLGTHEYYLCDLVSEQTHENGLVYHQSFLIKLNLVKVLITIAFIAVPIFIGVGIYFIIRKRRKKKLVSND